MPDHKKMYLHLFNAITDALTELREQDPGRAALILQKAQADTDHPGGVLYFMNKLQIITSIPLTQTKRCGKLALGTKEC